MNRILLQAVIAISLIKTSQCVNAIPGQPVPHADVLDELLFKYLGDKYSGNDLSDYILGNQNQNQDTDLAGENLDISVLDVDSVKKIVNFAKKKYNDELLAVNSDPRRVLHKIEKEEQSTYVFNPYVVNKTKELMRQAIYMTREKIGKTKPFRKQYQKDLSYQIAVLYGASTAIIGKMEKLRAQMLHFPPRTHFIWHLIIYEKILACNIDISNAAEKIFQLNKAFTAKRGLIGTVFDLELKEGEVPKTKTKS